VGQGDDERAAHPRVPGSRDRETAHQRGRYAALCEAIKRVRRDAATEPLTPQQQHGVDHAITVLENLGDDIFYRKGKATP